MSIKQFVSIASFAWLFFVFAALGATLGCRGGLLTTVGCQTINGAIILALLLFVLLALMFVVGAVLNPLMRLSKQVPQLLSIGKIVSPLQHTEPPEVRSLRIILEEALAEEAILAKSIAEGLMMINATGRVTYANDMALKILGLPEDQLLGRLYTDIWGRGTSKKMGDAKEYHPVRQAFLTGKRLVATSLPFVRSSGQSIPLALIATPLFVESTLDGVVVVFRDLTKEREIDRAKIEFVSLASHQLRTPLTTMNWYVEMLLGGDAGQLNDEQRQYLLEVYEANKRMANLVGSLLSVSQIDLGTFVIDPVPTDLAELAESALKELAPFIRKKKLIIDKRITRALPPLPSDPKLMRIIFQNLLSNAIKYTPSAGTITLEMAVQGKNILIRVADSGYGIPKTEQAKIFTKLFRADNIKSKETDGTGLGLYIVKSIVESSHGRIWFESEENKGTVFYVLLPLQKSSARRHGRKVRAAVSESK